MKPQRVLYYATMLGLATALAGCGSPAYLGAPGASNQSLSNALGRVPFRSVSGFRGGAMQITGRVQRQRYKLRVLPTLGGSLSFGQGINNRGQVVGMSLIEGSTALHAFRWQKGAIRDLGSLQGGPVSDPFTNPNERGDVSGFSNTQTPDPNGEDLCLQGNHLICLPFLWKDGKMTALPTLGGNNGQAYQANDRDEIAGVAENATFDSTCGSVSELEAKPVVWMDGKVTQLAMPSGDVDGWGYGMNDRGEVVGASGGCFAPTTWPATAVHILLWPNGVRGSYTDLGNLGQVYWNTAFFISDDDEVVGMAGVPSDLFHAFLWTKKSGMRDLGTLPGDLVSWANNINSRHQIVGTSFPPGSSSAPRGFIWQNGTMTDLNVVTGHHPHFYIAEAFGINDRGWIAGWGLLSNGNTSSYVLYPCDDPNALKSNGQGC